MLKAILVTLLLYLWSTDGVPFLPVQAGNVTASVDYGFGPLWIAYDPDVPMRCANMTFEFGGGFGPYVLGRSGGLYAKETQGEIYV